MWQLSAPGYKPIVTQLFSRDDKYLKNDSVFAVKDDLICDFLPIKGNDKAEFDLLHDFRMASYGDHERKAVVKQ